MKKTLVIMGSHPTGYDQFDWSRKDCDIWLFNEAPTAKKENGELLFPKCDAFFQLHHEAIWKSPKNWLDSKHYEWLASGKTPAVYMQQKYKEIPKSVKYPLKNALSLTKNVHMIAYGKEREFKCFSSTPDFALALVASMWKEGKRYKHSLQQKSSNKFCYKRVEIWGIELEMDTEYKYQRTGFGFWFGYLTALGIDLELHSAIFTAPMYGYESDVIMPPTIFEKRIAELTKELGEGKENYNKEAQELLVKVKELLNKDISNEIQEELNGLTKRYEKAGILNGKIRENLKYLEEARAMEEKSGVSVLSPGEFDGMRIEYKKQYIQVRTETTTLNANLGIIMKRLLNLKKGSHKRQRAIDEFGINLAELMNKNMLLLHLAGGIEENQYYLDSVKSSINKASK